MIDPQHARILEMMAQTIDIVTIALLSKPVGVQRREPPVLTLREKAVRRRPSADVQSKHLALTPYVVAITVYSQWEVEVKRRPAISGLCCQRAHLLLGLPLYVEMILLDLFVVVADS